MLGLGVKASRAAGHRGLEEVSRRGNTHGFRTTAAGGSVRPVYGEFVSDR